MKVLTEAEDPRVTGDGLTFEKPPFTDTDNKRQEAKGKKAKTNRFLGLQRGFPLGLLEPGEEHVR
jgi:hypothetical protein